MCCRFVENSTKSPLTPEETEAFKCSGRRIVEIMHLFKQIQNIQHEPFQCTFSNMRLEKEVRRGFLSMFHFKCELCGKKEIIHTEDPKRQKMDINTSMVSFTYCVWKI